MKPRIGMVGLGLSHPYTFAQVLRDLGAQPAYVWDPDPAKVADFAAQYGADPCESPEAIAAMQPDGVLVCGVASDHLAHALPFLRAGVPTFIDRPLAVDRGDLVAIIQAADQGRTPWFSTSILRYAAAFDPLREALANESLGTVLGATVTICHSIEAYLRPENTWQDEPERGGGTLMTMGQHALDLLASTLGTGWGLPHAVTARRRFLASRSEDTAAITLLYLDGRIATMNLISGSSAHGYSITLFGSHGTRTAQAPSGQNGPLQDYGYTGTMERFLDMVQSGLSPVPPAEMTTIAETLLRARLTTWPAP